MQGQDMFRPPFNPEISDFQSREFVDFVPIVFRVSSSRSSTWYFRDERFFRASYVPTLSLRQLVRLYPETDKSRDLAVPSSWFPGGQRQPRVAAQSLTLKTLTEPLSALSPT